MNLKRLNIEMKNVTNIASVLTHAHALVEGEEVDVDLLWERVTRVLRT